VENFRLDSRDDVVKFEELADVYAKRKAQFPIKHLSLSAFFDYCQQRDDGRRLFSAMLDIFINFLLLYCDFHEVGATWNENFSKGKLEGGSILDSEAKFLGKMDVHRFNSSFILRYRALWDKLMGLMIMLKAPNQYEKYSSASSRKAKFAKIAVEEKIMSQEDVSSISNLLEEFDNEFRTAEAHGTGALRKWTLSMESMTENPSIKIIGYWKEINRFMSDLGKTFQTGLDIVNGSESGAL
jgi:hypothetical protein